MRGARRCLEHGKASIETVGNVDLEAGKRDANATVGWQADVMDDEPQSLTRLKTCSDQYQANKATNSNGGLK
jgi:hypothetical protein